MPNQIQNLDESQVTQFQHSGIGLNSQYGILQRFMKDFSRWTSGQSELPNQLTPLLEKGIAII
jgi:hypothetical protein